MTCSGRQRAVENEDLRMRDKEEERRSVQKPPLFCHQRSASDVSHGPPPELSPAVFWSTSLCFKLQKNKTAPKYSHIKFQKVQAKLTNFLTRSGVRVAVRRS